MNAPAVRANIPDSKEKEVAAAAVITDGKVKSKLTDEEVQSMVDRVYEIRDLDKSQLNRQQKKALKQELITMKSKLESDPVVIVLSSTGVIILIILLIILL